MLETSSDPGRKHLIRLPRTVLVGKDVLKETPSILEDIEVSQALIISGPTTWEVAGQEISELLNSKDIEHKRYIAKQATKREVNEALTENRLEGVDCVLGVGGGKNIDIAKVVGRELKVPMLSIPTALSHDGLASPFASLKKREQKYSEYARSPRAVLVDLEKIAKAPKQLIKAGVGDIISNLNAVLDWKLAHETQKEYYGAYAGSLSEMSAKIVLESENGLKNMDLEAIRTLSEAVVSSGIAMGIAGSSRPASGAEHLFSHALDSINENLAHHGEQCALGTILMLHHRGDKRWKKVRAFLQTVGCPVTAEELEIPQKIIIKALVKAPKIRDRYTILSQKPLSAKEAQILAEDTGVV